MIKIVTPSDIIWRQIDNNELVTEFLSKLSSLLDECTSMKYNTLTMVIDLPKQLSSEDIQLIKYALMYSGWSATSSFKYAEKIEKFLYNYVLTPMVIKY